MPPIFYLPVAASLALGVMPATAAAQHDRVLRLPATEDIPALHVRTQPTSQRAQQNIGDVLYIHGATFPSDVSVFFRFDGRSWAGELNDAGFNAWGFDFAGYGHSGRYAETAASSGPPGRSVIAARQIAEVIEAIRARNGARAVHLIAHSWGTIAAGLYAAEHQDRVGKLVFFAPVVRRNLQIATPALPGYRNLTIWEQYRRFVEDVPRGHPQVLLDRHIEQWSREYLASDLQSATRTPPAVKTPLGPIADLQAAWTGSALYDPQRIIAPLLIVRGEWDSLCTDADAARLLSEAGALIKQDRKIAKGTHLLHLEENRDKLYRAVNEFLVDRQS